MKHLKQSISYITGTLFLFYVFLPLAVAMWELTEQGSEMKT